MNETAIANRALMLDTPKIIQTIAHPTAIVHLTVPREEICDVMGPGLKELMAAIAEQGIAPTGPWFTHHLKMRLDIFDFEISVPVNSSIAAAGRVAPSEWPAMKVARTIYQGPYECLGDAWGEFSDWIEAQGLPPAEDLWECYLAGPKSNPDPATFRTQLNRPLTN
jgi:effector-binding domain-containing protein